MPEITHLLFDCDNTLVLSEDLAFEACADLINTICKDKGLESEANYTGPSLIKEFVGQNFRGMLTTLKERKGLQITPEELEKYVTMEEDAVINKLKTSLVACPGVDEQLESLKDKYTYAVVSSSAFRRLRASVEKVDQAKYFPEESTFSAATSLPVPTSKPDPAVYLHALEKLGVKAENAVAIEDSKSGTLSGTRASIKVIGYTGPYPADEKEKMAQVLKDAGAVIIMDDWSEFPAALAKIAAGEV
jgi:HAD superfamily hydrolase (TIGR01509 family)